MGNDFKLFHRKSQLTSICGGRLFPVRGTVQGFTLNGAEFKPPRFSSALSLPELQPRLLEVGVTIEIEAGL